MLESQALNINNWTTGSIDNWTTVIRTTKITYFEFSLMFLGYCKCVITTTEKYIYVCIKLGVEIYSRNCKFTLN